MQKECTKCKQVKDLSAFSRDYRRVSEVSSHCKLCKSEYRKQNREKLNTKQRERRAGDSLYRENQKARNAIGSKIRRGVITPPPACERCGAIGKVEAHHTDYNNHLNVDWLCVDCHHKQHIKIRRKNEKN